MRPGVWVRSGQTAVITGLDWVAIRAAMPPRCDVERVEALLGCFEDGMIGGAEESARDAMEAAKQKSGAQ